MPTKGCLMICLAALSCVSKVGCLRSAALPPSASIPRSSNRAVPRESIMKSDSFQSPYRSGPRIRFDNPWKPDVPARDWKYLVIHHTASNSGSVERIHQEHLQKKDKAGNQWLGIGYHFVIGNGNGMGDGEIQPTFRWKEQIHGAHAGVNEYNQHGIGIVLVGNFEQRSPTPVQLAAVKRLIGTLKSQYQIPTSHVVGHADVKATACPGRYFPLDEVSQVAAAPSFTQRTGEPSVVRMAGIEESRQQ